MTDSELKQLLELAEKRNSKDYEWTKNVILMASGLLGILVSLHNNKSSNCYTHYFFCITIATIGLGILSGTIFLYAETSTLHRLLQNANMTNSKINVAKPYGIYKLMRYICYVSFFLAIPSLIIYAILLDSI